MRFEHVAFNVAEPVAMAEWYVAHLGMSIRLALDTAPWTRFIADSGGTAMFEIYVNPAAPIPDYRGQDPLVIHIAFSSEDPDRDAARLCSAGATPATEARGDDGSLVITLRDPWGLPFQLCRRATPLL